MTRRVYKSAMGKEVDLGALLLQNEQTRAVGNMNVNARGDVLDGANRVIDTKNRQVQRQYQRTTTNVSADVTVQSSTKVARQSANKPKPVEALVEENLDEEFKIDSEPDMVAATEPVVAPAPLPENTFGPTGEGGLAAAIARSRTIKQEKEKTLREKAREQQIKRI